MATTEVTLNGNGTTGPYSYSGVFNAIKPEDVKVSINDVTKTYTTDYTVNFTGSTITFVTETPSSSDSIRIYRVTDADNPAAVFSSGSALRAVDLNDNFLQTLYVSQEVVRDVGGAAIDVNTAVQAAASAETAASNAETAANNAVSVANTANTTANTANTTANTANTTANTANNTANTALNNATAAVTAANNAVTTANTAVTTADGAVTTADAAAHDATVALNLVSAIVDFLIVANVAAIPSSPANDDGVEILDTTGIESFTPLTGVPVGFTGSADLRAKIRYNATGSTWEWISYTAVDPESRYVNSTNGVISTSLGVGTSSPSTALEVAVSNSTILSTSTGNSSGKLAVNSNRAAGLIGGQLVSKWNDNDVARIDFYNGADGTNKDDGAIGIATSNNSSSPQTRVYVAQDGNVGIGTASPGQILDVSNNDNPAILLNNSNTDNSSSRSSRLALNIGNTLAAGIRAQTGAGENASDASLGFSTGGDGTFSKMRILANGNVGIGTTSPTTTLDVNGIAKIGAPTGSAYIEVGQGATESRFAYIDFVGDTTYTDYGLRLIRNNQGANATSQLTHRGTGDLSIRTEQAADISFITNNLEQARIDSTGSLLVGTSSALSNVYVKGSAVTPQIQLSGNSGGTSAMSITRTTGAASNLILQRGQTGGGAGNVVDGDAVGQINFNGFDGTNYRNTAQITSEVDGTPGANSVPGRLVFSTTASGVGSPTERMRINSDGTTVFSGPVTLPAGSTVAGYRATFNHITDDDSTSPNDHQWVSVLTPGTTITLPALPTDGMEIRISVGNFTNTVVAANGNKIMNDTADLTIDVAYKTVTLIYDGLTVGPTPVFGWRII